MSTRPETSFDLQAPHIPLVQELGNFRPAALAASRTVLSAGHADGLARSRELNHVAGGDFGLGLGQLGLDRLGQR